MAVLDNDKPLSKGKLQVSGFSDKYLKPETLTRPRLTLSANHSSTLDAYCNRADTEWTQHDGQRRDDHDFGSNEPRTDTGWYAIG